MEVEDAAVNMYILVLGERYYGVSGGYHGQF